MFCAVDTLAAHHYTVDYNTSDNRQMTSTLGWESLHHRRTIANIVIMYRVIQRLVEMPVGMFLHTASLVTRGRDQLYLVPYYRTDGYRKTHGETRDMNACKALQYRDWQDIIFQDCIQRTYH